MCMPSSKKGLQAQLPRPYTWILWNSGHLCTDKTIWIGRMSSKNIFLGSRPQSFGEGLVGFIPRYPFGTIFSQSPSASVGSEGIRRGIRMAGTGAFVEVDGFDFKIGFLGRSKATNIYVHLCIYPSVNFGFMFVCSSVCIYIYICVCVCVFVYTHLYECVYIYISSCIIPVAFNPCRGSRT